MGIIVNCDNVMGILVIRRMYKEVADALIAGHGWLEDWALIF